MMILHLQEIIFSSNMYCPDVVDGWVQIADFVRVYFFSFSVTV